MFTIGAPDNRAGDAAHQQMPLTDCHCCTKEWVQSTLPYTGIVIRIIPYMVDFLPADDGPYEHHLFVQLMIYVQLMMMDDLT